MLRRRLALPASRSERCRRSPARRPLFHVALREHPREHDDDAGCHPSGSRHRPVARRRQPVDAFERRPQPQRRSSVQRNDHHPQQPAFVRMLQAAVPPVPAGSATPCRRSSSSARRRSARGERHRVRRCPATRRGRLSPKYQAVSNAATSSHAYADRTNQNAVCDAAATRFFEGHSAPDIHTINRKRHPGKQQPRVAKPRRDGATKDL